MVEGVDLTLILVMQSLARKGLLHVFASKKMVKHTKQE